MMPRNAWSRWVWQGKRVPVPARGAIVGVHRGAQKAAAETPSISEQAEATRDADTSIISVKCSEQAEVPEAEAKEAGYKSGNDTARSQKPRQGIHTPLHIHHVPQSDSSSL